MKKWNSPLRDFVSGFALRGKMEFFLSYLFLGAWNVAKMEFFLRLGTPFFHLHLHYYCFFIIKNET